MRNYDQFVKKQKLKQKNRFIFYSFQSKNPSRFLNLKKKPDKTNNIKKWFKCVHLGQFG